ncbi:hypothetical protein CVO77_04195 [Sphingopyxis lindanitolerans]|uniref:Uncharacterized protein n=2 Tax=Sphingopyxis lindanitolerans TaxID=2054227 RepID=A0A2S8B5U0_9SPHN|nr:hypothetical protein CVO77_04195 [Sphingopyxis lindanitolerans]
MTLQTKYPAGPVIEKRNWKFGRGMTARRWWHGGDAAPLRANPDQRDVKNPDRWKAGGEGMQGGYLLPNESVGARSLIFAAAVRSGLAVLHRSVVIAPRAHDGWAR